MAPSAQHALGALNAPAAVMRGALEATLGRAGLTVTEELLARGAGVGRRVATETFWDE